MSVLQTSFQESFKYYKAKDLIPDFSEVLDFDNESIKVQDSSVFHPKLLDDDSLPPGVVPTNQWKCYELNNRPGLIFIRNPFTRNGQRYWISKCLRDYTKSPNVNNLDSKTFKQHIIDDWWNSLQTENDIKFREKLKKSMRWITLGYHHDWDIKIYNEKMKNEFPNDLANLCRFFVNSLNYEKYSPEAAIINFYPIGTTLAGHTDRSESNLEAPLISFSFGQTAIFLIGGHTKDEKPTAMYLKSGDIVVMSKESRLCYHAVPRVMKSNKEPWNDDNQTNVEDRLQDLPSSDDSLPKPKRIKCNEEKFRFDDYNFDHELWMECSDENFWRSFNRYLQDSRINFNVRQVLKEGQNSLEDEVFTDVQK